MVRVLEEVVTCVETDLFTFIQEEKLSNLLKECWKERVACFM